MVRNRRDSSSFHTVEHAGVFNSNRHWMSCEALGVGNHEFVGAVREGIPQGTNLGLSRTTARRRVSFMRKENGIWGDLMPVNAPLPLHARYEIVHCFCNVVHIKPSAMER